MAGVNRSELLEYFLSEADDHINTLDKGISELESDPDNDTIIEDLYRAAHTLKGAAALVKLSTTSNIAHRMEDILEELKDRKIKADREIAGLLFYMLDSIKGLVQDISEGREEDPAIEQAVFARADEVMSREKMVVAPPAQVSPKIPDLTVATPAVSEKREAAGRRKEDFEFFSGNFVKVDVRKVEEMLNLIGEITIKKNYLLQKTKETGEISDEIFFAGRRLLKEITDFADRYAYSLPDNVKYIDPLLSEFGELEFDRYDELNLFARKLQEITNDITEALKDLSDFFEFFGDDVKTIGNMIKMLRSDISEARMVEIGRLFQRFVRPIKEMAGQYDKKVELLVSGGDTKVDKVIFERLFDPLMHIIRNAVSHGIEKPDERLQKGKKEEGLIFLSARQDGNTVIIEVNDNGRGIDTDRLFDVAVRKGLLNPDSKPSKEDILSLIFAPGFSTTESADMTSGRGMGMSAVRRLVSAINGIVEVDTDVGWGTTFRIKVPSSLAIANVIVFRAGGVEFVIPSSLLEEIIQLGATNVREEITLINYRGKDIHAVNLSDLLGISHQRDFIPGSFPDISPAVICNITDRKAALIVDEIIGQEETIIKPMNRFLGGLHIYSGTTISGDGRVRFVINPIRIFEEKIQPVAVRPVSEEGYEGRRILIVDDSLSVRKYVSAFLEARQFRVYSASNGVEALNILDERPVDMVITDLEMPVMHGYELINRIKGSERLKDIPVIVLTSRSAEKHREKALESGAEDYLVKPFEEKSLSEILRKYLSASHRNNVS
ncbi:MAG: response regulator [Candidatus Methanomethylicaceae archaeon]